MKKLILKIILGTTFITLVAINMAYGIEGIEFKDATPGNGGGGNQSYIGDGCDPDGVNTMGTDKSDPDNWVCCGKCTFAVSRQ